MNIKELQGRIAALNWVVFVLILYLDKHEQTEVLEILRNSLSEEAFTFDNPDLNKGYRAILEVILESMGVMEGNQESN